MKDMVLVEWKDACNTANWTTADEYNAQPTLTVHSIGYLYHEEAGVDGFVELVQNIADSDGDSEQLCGRMSIPKRSIISIRTLEHVTVDILETAR